jgi:hypothetical protein
MICVLLVGSSRSDSISSIEILSMCFVDKDLIAPNPSHSLQGFMAS